VGSFADEPGKSEKRFDFHKLRGEAKSHAEDALPTLNAADKCIFQEAGKLQSGGRASLRILQFCKDGAIRCTPAMAGGVTNTLWTVRDLDEMVKA
jgi:hypothetical protein